MRHFWRHFTTFVISQATQCNLPAAAVQGQKWMKPRKNTSTKGEERLQ